MPGGSIVRPTLFDLFLNDYLLFILIASVHNFAEDNSLSNIARTVVSLKQTLNGFMKTK